MNNLNKHIKTKSGRTVLSEIVELTQFIYDRKLTQQGGRGLADLWLHQLRDGLDKNEHGRKGQCCHIYQH